MKNLESLDLSSNKLNGEIPVSISSLSFLSFLNLSYNDFSGQIPLGTQLQTSMLQALLGILDFVELLYLLTALKIVVMLMCQRNMEEAMMMPLKLSHCTLGWVVGFAVGFWGFVVLYS
ncbi:Phytosulfokine receptor 1 [Spatholobus suberectus]|nr:Phytosulfokine receptor 1 [Spatholobus suberectus]